MMISSGNLLTQKSIVKRIKLIILTLMEEFKNKKAGQFQILKKKAVSSNLMLTNSRDSRLPTSATSNHTSSIPSLPPVVKDSWFKDKVAMQNLNDLKKRLQQKGENLYEIYQDSDTNDKPEMAARSSAESSYFLRGNQVRTNQV